MTPIQLASAHALAEERRRKRHHEERAGEEDDGRLGERKVAHAENHGDADDQRRQRHARSAATASLVRKRFRHSAGLVDREQDRQGERIPRPDDLRDRLVSARDLAQTVDDREDRRGD